MKTVNTIVKILAALAAVAGAVYVAATYGDKIVAWAKRILGFDKFESVVIHDIPEESVTEEDIAPEVQEAEAPAEDSNDNVVAAESDFEG